MLSQLWPMGNREFGQGLETQHTLLVRAGLASGSLSPWGWTWSLVVVSLGEHQQAVLCQSCLTLSAAVESAVESAASYPLPTRSLAGTSSTRTEPKKSLK